MANLYIRGKTIWVFYSMDGKQFQTSTKLKNTKKNKAVVLNKLAYLEDIVADNGSIPTNFFRDERELSSPSASNRKTKYPDDMSFRQVYEKYISEFLKSRVNKSYYKCAVESWEKFSDDRPIKSFTANHITYWQNQILADGYAYETMRTYSRYVKIIFNYAIKLKLYDEINPVIVPKAREKKLLNTMKDEHAKKIFKYLKKENTNLYQFVYFLYLTGLRVNEALSLTWDNILFDKQLISMITFKDQKRPDIFPLNIDNKLVPFLKSFEKKEGKLFEHTSGYLIKCFQKALKKCKLPKHTLHDLRRTFATRYASILKPIELKTLMRHKNVDTTLKYYVEIDILDIGKKLNGK